MIKLKRTATNVMNLQSLPTELLLAFCRNPYEVVSLRLTCRYFYENIPHVRSVFVRVSETFAVWFSGFWVIIARTSGKLTHIQYRAPAGLTPQMLSELMATYVEKEHDWTIGWDNCDYLWFVDDLSISMSYKFGLHFVEDRERIYLFVKLLCAGEKRIADVVRTLTRGAGDVILVPRNDTDDSDTMFYTYITDYKNVPAFAGCEQDYKVYRRSV